MANALIGHTGFVGSNLLAQGDYSHCFNSRTIEEMRGDSFDSIVCAGVSAVKWKANKNPEADWAGIQKLIDVLRTVSTKRFDLISTIDVYPRQDGLDEAFDCSSEPNHPYGTHRFKFEQFCTERFTHCTVIRLPALFGHGLKKNVIFDLLNDNCLDMINPASSFQYYHLDRLTSDINRVRASGVSLINFFTDPVSTQLIIDSFFSGKSVGQNPAPDAHYDLRTRHAELWGKDGPYIQRTEEVLTDLGRFIATK